MSTRLHATDAAPPTRPAAPPSREGVVPPLAVIEPADGWQPINVRELWQFRELLYFLTWRDVKVRYKQTLLGVAWAVLQPLMMMAVFTIFFGRMAGVPSGGMPYPLFVYAGLLPWTFFATAVTNAGNSVVGSERLITKIYFPRLAVPFAAVGAAVVDFAIAFGLLLAMMAYYRVAPGWGMLLALVICALIVLAALGVGTLLAALNVAYRDFRYVIPFMIQLGLFATPTVYMQPALETASTASAQAESAAAQAGVAPGGAGPDRGRGAVPSQLRWALSLNPMTPLIGSFRAAALGGPIPWQALTTASAGVVVIFVAGCLYFRRVEDTFADII